MEFKDYIKLKEQQYDQMLKYNLNLRSLGMCASSDKWDDPQHADGVPIKAKKATSNNDPNIKINHDFDNKIAKGKAGYFATNIQREYSEDIDDSVKEKYLNFDNLNNTDVLTTNIARHCAYWGNSYTVCYLDKNKNARIKEVNAWNGWILYDENNTPKYGFINYRENNEDYCYMYDNVNKYLYKKNSDDGWSLKDTKPHGFGIMPMVEWKNDDECTGNTQRSIALIDSYDRIVSSLASEVDVFANAYLLLSNMGDLTEEQQELFKRTGVLVTDNENSKAEFITKDISPEFAKLVMETIYSNIWIVSSVVDPKTVGGMTSATAFQVAQMYRETENDAMVTESLWNESLEYLDLILKSYWTRLDTSGIQDYDTKYINYEFKRNIPVDVLQELESMQRAGVQLPNKYKISKALGIDDTTAEDLNEQAQEEMIDILPSNE